MGAISQVYGLPQAQPYLPGCLICQRTDREPVPTDVTVLLVAEVGQLTFQSSQRFTRMYLVWGWDERQAITAHVRAVGIGLHAKCVVRIWGMLTTSQIMFNYGGTAGTSGTVASTP